MSVDQKRLTIDEFLKLAAPFVAASELQSLRPNLIDELRDENHGSSELEDYLKILAERDVLKNRNAQQISEIKRARQELDKRGAQVARLKGQVNWLEDQGARQALRDALQGLHEEHEQLKKVHAKVVASHKVLSDERARLKDELAVEG